MQRGNTLIFLLISILIIAGGAYYLGRSSTPKLSTTPIVTSQTPKSISTSPTPSDETANWKIYTNQKYKFTIKYPNDFYTKEVTSQYDDTFSINITNSDNLNYGGGIESLGRGKMAITINVGGTDFKRNDFYYGGYQWTKSILDALVNVPVDANVEHKYDTLTKLKDVTLNGFTSVEYKSTPRKGVATEGLTLINVALIKDNRTFLITYKMDDENLLLTKPYSEIFDQILSTFKFTE